jgi:hypothetical protein
VARIYPRNSVRARGALAASSSRSALGERAPEGQKKKADDEVLPIPSPEFRDLLFDLDTVAEADQGLGRFMGQVQPLRRTWLRTCAAGRSTSDIRAIVSSRHNRWRAEFAWRCNT